ncbi:hypothetical protein FH063_000492 [Azospirillum argentinense]|uniref:Uncharacterized protein n=1 Tax=Azospirillum argentinense TaxID=2970906 RepID=A0A5B0L0C1_9PROT|nr:hypothetical protein FH063_000492 [Azospirillum argentinense]
MTSVDAPPGKTSHRHPAWALLPSLLIRCRLDWSNTVG